LVKGNSMARFATVDFGKRMTLSAGDLFGEIAFFTGIPQMEVMVCLFPSQRSF
jgi:hypothetical protein